MTAAKTIYRQCVLRGKNTVRTTWIPQKYAVAGKTLKLRDNGKWIDGWRVEKVGAATIADDLDVNKDIREHKKRTGDSMRKEPAQ